MRMNTHFRVLVGGVLAVALSACGGAPSSDEANSACTGTNSPETSALYEEAAKESGTVIVYSSWIDETNQELAKDFAQCYPDAPTVQILSIATSDVETRFAAENQAKAKTADVVINTITGIESAYNEGWVSEVTADDIPEIANYDDKYVFPFGAVATVAQQVMIFNTDEVGDEKPASVEDLADPAYKGRLSLGDPNQSTANLTAWYAIQQKLGSDFLKRVAAQNPNWQASALNGAALAGSGEAAVYYPSYPGLQTMLEGKGAPVESIATEIASGAAAIAAVSTESKSPKTADLFVNYLLSEEGQSVVQALGQATVREGIPAMNGHPAPAVMPADFEIALSADLEVARAQVSSDLGLG